MTATNPLSAVSVDLADWDANDTSSLTSYLSTLTDGDKTTGIVAIGAAPNDGLRLLFPDASKIAAGDTVSIWVSALSTFTTMALIPYDDELSVNLANKITLTAATGENKFTLTQAFIDDLFVSPTDKWTVRMVEDSGISGSATVAEVTSDLSVGGGGGSPGSSPGNAPANYKYLKNQRLMTNSSLSRMPRNQNEWSAFMHELQKWIKDETGTFDIGGSNTAQFTGFSSDPASSSIWWHRYGQMVHLEFNIGTGTSDQTYFTITGIPEVITPRDDCTYPLFGLWDNGATIVDRGSVKIGSDSVITFYTDHADGAWTDSSTKGFTASLGAKGLIYDLRNPPKQ